MSDVSRPEFDSLQQEVRSFEQRLVDDRIDRAARSMENARHWMMFYTATLTLFLTFVGYLGYKGLSDIDANRKRVEGFAAQAETTSRQAKNTVAEASGTLESTKQATEQFKTQVKNNKDLLAGLQTSVDELRRKNKEIQTSQDQTEQRQENLSVQVDRYQSVADQLGGVVSSSLKVPVITTMSFSKDVLNIHGYGFGPSQGRLFFKIFENERHQNLLNLTIEPHAVEVSGEQILSWSDNKVTCRQSKIPKAVGTPVMVQLMTSTGNKSYTFNLPSRR